MNVMGREIRWPGLKPSHVAAVLKSSQRSLSKGNKHLLSSPIFFYGPPFGRNRRKDEQTDIHTRLAIMITMMGATERAGVAVTSSAAVQVVFGSNLGWNISYHD
jgi:hypothetical protein